MVRAHIRLNTAKDVQDFVSTLNSDGTADKYVISDASNHYCADARSMLGVLYAMSEFNDTMYLVNETEDGKFPSTVDKYRVL